jgi:DNA polymerase I
MLAIISPRRTPISDKMSKQEKPLLVLIDGMALAYRSYFAFISRPLTNARGENTSAVFGFTNALLQFLDTHKPQYACVCFDTAAPTFRHEMFTEYKATREAMPDDMRPQIQIIKDIVKAYNIPQLEMPGYEADDIIGTLAKEAEKKGIESLIITPDKDYSQLVTENIKLLKPTRDTNVMELVDIEGVKTKYGLSPLQFIDYLALVGDTSDNIPGVRGVGEKTAAPLLQEYGSIEGIYKNIEKITKKGLKDKLVNEKENAFLSYQLATIKLDVQVGVHVNDLQYNQEPDFRTLEKILKDQGFKSLLERLRKEELALKGELQPEMPEEEAHEVVSEASIPVAVDGTDIHSRKHTYHTSTTLTELYGLAKKLQKSEEFCFDLETTSSSAMRAEMIGISFSVKPGEAYYIPVRVESKLEPTNLFSVPLSEAEEKNAYNTGFAAKEVVEIFKPILENKNIRKVGQNIKYDMLVMKNYGVEVLPAGFDTMIAASLLGNEGAISMDDLSLKYLGYTPIPLSALAGKMKKGDSFEIMTSLNTDKLAEYGAEDADITLQLKNVLQAEITKQGLENLCNTVEFPIIETLTKVEFNGVKIDTDMLAKASKEMETEAKNTCAKIYEYAGMEFSIDSTKQLSDVLFNKLKLTPTKKTKTGYSTDASVLEQLKAQHPIAELLLDYRQYQKLRSTYVDALPLLVNPKTGLIHTSYNQAVAATGRLSSNEPNLQNIPIRTEMGRSLRKAFVSRFKNGQILSADYSQIELRIIAHVTKDKNLLDSFKNNEDIHTNTAAAVFGVTKEEVTRDMRRKAKEVNYGIMYGIGAFGLSSRLGISQKEGAEIIKKYFMAFPSIKEYIDDTIAFVRKHGYVQTLLGRRRYMTNINASNQAVRAADERASINMPIQGDELVFDVYPGEEEQLKPIVVEGMRNAMPMDVNIDVDAGIGKTWYDAH